MKILPAKRETIEEAARALASGLLVAFPTETVYGLGADASNKQALARLYKAKGRPEKHPVIVHLADLHQIDDWAVNVPEAARKLAAAFWPGPLTLILPKKNSVLPEVTGGQNTVGLRIPRHPIAQQLLRQFGSGVAAPSANKFGRLSPTAAEDVAHDFGGDVAIVLDGGFCEVGIESTIVDFSLERPRILRPGMILPDQIEALSGPLDRSASVSSHTTRAPGTLASHYAPRTLLEVAPPERLVDSVELALHEGKRVCVLSFQEPGALPVQKWLIADPDAGRYARQLYRSIRRLDEERADLILVESVPASDEWSGVADRLKRAAGGKGISGRGENGKG